MKNNPATWPGQLHDTTETERGAILAFVDTFPCRQRRANFTMPRSETRKDRYAFDGRLSSVDFLPMTLRTKFLITALFLCHQLLASALVTSQLLSENSGAFRQIPQQILNRTLATHPPRPQPAVCGSRAVTQLKDGTILCSIEQEKVGESLPAAP